MTVCAHCNEAGKPIDVDCPRGDHCRGMHCTLECPDCRTAINLGGRP